MNIIVANAETTIAEVDAVRTDIEYNVRSPATQLLFVIAPPINNTGILANKI